MALHLGHKAEAAGYQLAAFASTVSTNLDAMAAARAGGDSGKWFVTTEQTAGRGRRARSWDAPRGNLASSVFELLDCTPATAATLGFAAGLAIHQALVTVASQSGAMPEADAFALFRLKWPNDVLADGQKLCGILLEAEALPCGRIALVAGIGTNVVAHPVDTPYAATSLHALGVAISADELFAALSDAWADSFSLWDMGRGFSSIKQAWLARARGVGEHVSINAGSTTISGVFETIDEAGCLVVITDDGTRRTIAAGDVVFGSVASTGAK